MMEYDAGRGVEEVVEEQGRKVERLQKICISRFSDFFAQ